MVKKKEHRRSPSSPTSNSSSSKQLFDRRVSAPLTSTKIYPEFEKSLPTHASTLPNYPTSTSTSPSTSTPHRLNVAQFQQHHQYQVPTYQIPTFSQPSQAIRCWSCRSDFSSFPNVSHVKCPYCSQLNQVSTTPSPLTSNSSHSPFTPTPLSPFTSSFTLPSPISTTSTSTIHFTISMQPTHPYSSSSSSAHTFPSQQQQQQTTSQSVPRTHSSQI